MKKYVLMDLFGCEYPYKGRLPFNWSPLQSVTHIEDALYLQQFYEYKLGIPTKIYHRIDTEMAK